MLDELQELIPGSIKYANYLACRCMFHDDHSPSMIIGEKTYQCLSCGKYGRTKELLAHLSGQPVRQSPGQFKPGLWRKANLQENSYEDVAIEAHRNLKRNPDYSYYLRKRHVDSLIDKMLIGYLDGFYVFPVHDQQHDIVGLVARAGPVLQAETGIRYIIPPHQPPLLYGDWGLTRNCQNLFVPYGILDALSLISAGVPALSGTSGHNVPGDLFKNIRTHIYIIEDGDGKDHQAAVKLMLELGWRGKIVQPNYARGKDCNDVLCTYGTKGLRQIMDEVISSDGIYKWKLEVAA